MNKNELEKFRQWAVRELSIAMNSTEDELTKKICLDAEFLIISMYHQMEEEPEEMFEKFRNILSNLLFSKVLTPIEDIPDNWDLLGSSEKATLYQCNRYQNLLKRVDAKTGEVSYHDTKRYICVNINDLKDTWIGGIGSVLLNEKMPITFPYTPEDTKIRVYMEKFSYYDEEDDFDTISVLTFGKPNENIIDVYRFFKKDVKGELVEITKSEYFGRKSKVQKKLNEKFHKKMNETMDVKDLFDKIHW